MTSTAGVRDAFWLLRLGYVAAPVLAGADKLTTHLVDWNRYLAPAVARRVPNRLFMKVVGGVEIAAGLLVAVRPRWGGWLVGGWLAGIIGNLMMTRDHYYDIALRDLGLALGAVALARLARARETAY